MAHKRKSLKGAARPRKRTKTLRLGAELVKMKPSDVRQLHDLESVSIQPPQHFEVLLQYLSQSNDESIVQNNEEFGYGIIRLVPTNRGVLMRPTASIDDDECSHWLITDGEYTADYRHIYGLDDHHKKTPVDILTISEHAVYPCLSQQRRSSATTVMPHLGTPLRFSRSAILPKESGIDVVDKYSACDFCEDLLCADEYVHCSRCDKIFHLACTTAGEGHPFVLRNGALYDKSEKKVQCPACSGANDDRDSHVKALDVDAGTSDYTFDICIDIGSTTTKVSVRWLDGKHDTSDFIRLAQMPVSAVSVANDIVFASDDLHALYRGGNDDVHVIQPIKNLLYQKSYQEVAKKLNVQIEDTFRALFEYVFQKALAAYAPSLRQWATAANGCLSPTTSRLSIALPSGLSLEEKPPVLTALYKEGVEFLKTLSIERSETNVTDLSESDTARLGAFGSQDSGAGKPPNGTKWIAVFDIGGTTGDFTLHRLREDAARWHDDIHVSQSVVAGTTCEVRDLIDAFGELSTADWKGVSEWVWAATTENDNKALQTYANLDLSKTWRHIHQRYVKLLLDWLVEKCKQCNEIIDPAGLANLCVVLAGGALVNSTLAVDFNARIKDSLPNSTIVDKAYTDVWRSLVLEGLEIHASLADTITRSPVTILFGADANLESECEDTNYVILLMKGDPLVRNGLVHRSQAQPGELITHDVAWSESDFEVVYYALRERPKDTYIHNGLLSTSAIQSDSCEIIARFRLPMPRDRPEQVFTATWADPTGQTIRTEFFIFNDKRTDIDRNTSHALLRQEAVHYDVVVHGLNTCSLDKSTSIDVLAA
ncbi:hypothetical protein T440DRAFT_484535 [Plenodomus tracheiphilus IPT5]|uniref:Uncharacterized protein n=1 Tax=Plenodomus tracheiphilus IPT5 TaxID=1408161 RepID=A0A6A7ALJ2_9PLEO|nr:hypothetical protein T440DRAFT_484535 [Plenodomus tracheiphilus IPT5]